MSKLRRKPLFVTRRGAVLAGANVALVVAGLLSADGWMMTLGISGWLVWLSAWWIGKMNLNRLEFSMDSPKRVHAGREFEMELCLRNGRGALDAFDVGVLLEIAGEVEVEKLAGWTPARCGAKSVVQVSVPRRGHSDEHEVVLESFFPFGLFRQRKSFLHSHGLTVLPRLITPLELNEDGSSQDAEPIHGLSSGQHAGEPRGVRSWQAGDSARRIHWPASARSIARGHGLRVREFDPPGFFPDHCHVVFHSYASGGEILREDRFERAISLLAGALHTMMQRGIPVELTADFFDWESVPCLNRAQWAELMHRLAFVQRCTGVESHDFQAALRSIPAAHTLLLVSDMPPESWTHLLESHPHTLVVDIRQVRYRNQTLRAASA